MSEIQRALDVQTSHGSSLLLHKLQGRSDSGSDECSDDMCSDGKMGDDNYPPLGMRKEAEDNNAMKINRDCHNQILDEIVNRERLEYDPTRVYTDQKEEDEDSDME